MDEPESGSIQDEAISGLLTDEQPTVAELENEASSEFEDRIRSSNSSPPVRAFFWGWGGGGRMGMGFLSSDCLIFLFVVDSI